MDRVRARAPGGGEEQVDAQVRVGRGVPRQPHREVGLADVRRVGVGVAVHRDRLDPERPARADDPAGDLAAVGDQHALDRSVSCGGGHRAHIRNTP